MPKHQNKNKKGSSQQTKIKERFVKSKTEKRKKEIQKEEEIPKITEEEKEKYLQKFKRKYVEKEKKEQQDLIRHPKDLKTPVKQKEIGIETAQRVIQPIIKHNESKITFSRTNKRNENITSQFKETSDGFDIPKTKTERQKTIKLQTEITFNNQSFDDESTDQNDYGMNTINEIEQPIQENNHPIHLEEVDDKNKTTMTFTENENKVLKLQINQQEEQSEDSFVIHRNNPIEMLKKELHPTEIEQGIQPMQFETTVEINETSYKTPTKYQFDKKQLIQHEPIQHTSPRQSPKKRFKKEKQFNTTVVIPKKQEETKKLVLIEDSPINEKDINKKDESFQEKVNTEDNQEITEETSSILSVMSFGEEREMNSDKIPMEIIEEEKRNKNEESMSQKNFKDNKVITSELMSKNEEQTTLLSILPFGEERIKGINGLREMKEIDILEANEQKQKESIKKTFTQERKDRITKKLARPHEMIQFNDGNQVISQMSVVETKIEEESTNQEAIPIVQEIQKIPIQQIQLINNEIEEVKISDVQLTNKFIDVDIIKEIKEVVINNQNKVFCEVKEEETVYEKYILKPCRFLRQREKECVEFPCIPPRIKTPPLEHHMAEEEKHFLEPEPCFNDYYRLKPKCCLKEELCIVPLRKQLNWKALNNPQMKRVIEEDISIPMGYFSRVFLDNDTDFEDDFVESTNSKLKIVF
ncbi:glutamic acid-rich protein precursor, putative [Entamoeba dispar SAW760]|uniref:Glutamic acid-rich protein, putative n=1 Tax=Entamoeba dispar (strain ATCC PRA-260 / SAW760) TaxID=370354 RepID=B0EHS2_ENTDS|nr:glutamic acid-rich protein precursor, putative [Entamoeba dispar SAW760]EDR25866.1 glutamic acid-rich protein precursor, putative [Entamoeba dispar SAW760]|eukprot:EDR25866.1 glutamic acid-rich protein precursor, putative [Entamoeba dispar SAW760]